MITAGIDVGAATTKAIILKDNEIVSSFVIPTSGDVVKAADKVIKEVFLRAELTIDDIECVVSTGYGRNSVDFSNKSITEIACHAKGANYLFPNARMVIDIGGQDSKAIHMEDSGRVTDFVMNDKCAAGTGRFLEVMASVLGLRLEELGDISKKSREPCRISSICTVFAESEVVSLRAEKKLVEDIIRGVHQSVSKRVVSMAKPMGILEPIIFSGGVAKNSGVKRALEQELDTEISTSDEPQIVGALGAALIARDLLK